MRFRYQASRAAYREKAGKRGIDATLHGGANKKTYIDAVIAKRGRGWEFMGKEYILVAEMTSCVVVRLARLMPTSRVSLYKSILAIRTV